MQNILDPAILFFVFGLFAGLIKSNLEIPQPISRFLSLYLLMALGLKGGFALEQSGLTSQIASSLGLAIALAIVVPTIGYVILKRLWFGQRRHFYHGDAIFGNARLRLRWAYGCSDGLDGISCHYYRRGLG
jgi:hypothetical protein